MLRLSSRSRSTPFRSLLILVSLLASACGPAPMQAFSLSSGALWAEASSLQPGQEASAGERQPSDAPLTEGAGPPAASLPVEAAQPLPDASQVEASAPAEIPAAEAPAAQAPAAPASSEPASEPALDPLRIVLPDPGPAPVSAWRPPLYPTPWAPTPYDHFFFSRPIGADEVNWPLPDYRYGGVFFKDFVHTGVDIPSPTGTAVLAAGPGLVTWAGYGLYSQRENFQDPYGLAIAIRHDFGYNGEILNTVYGHMSEIYFAKGQRVEAGDLIGLVGETGNTTGPHLHFEVRQGKNNYFTSRNPELWISPPQGWGILAGRVMKANGDFLKKATVDIYNRETGQKWQVISYGEGSTNSDPYYRENLVIGDLPAGQYKVWIKYEGVTYAQELEILPGIVSYFTFYGKKGFSLGQPDPPGGDFQPSEVPAP